MLISAFKFICIGMGLYTWCNCTIGNQCALQLRLSTQYAALYSPKHYSTANCSTICLLRYGLKSTAFLMFQFMQHSTVSRGFHLHMQHSMHCCNIRPCHRALEPIAKVSGIQQCSLAGPAEDKQRFEDQLQAHPKLATMIAAYEEKQQELQTLKKSKSKKISRGSKKRRRPEEKEASDDDEVCHSSASTQCVPRAPSPPPPPPPSPPPPLGQARFLPSAPFSSLCCWCLQ